MRNYAVQPDGCAAFARALEVGQSFHHGFGHEAGNKVAAVTDTRGLRRS